MIYTCKPIKISIYINSGRKSLDAIKRETGCDIIINGGLFDMTRFTPNCWLKVDGRLKHSETWNDWGLAWDSTDLKMVSSVNIGDYLNFISCVPLIRAGAAQTLSYPAELGGKRGRTAIGVTKSGNVLVFCTRDGTTEALTPENLQMELLKLSVQDALMLDGGLSSQYVTPIGAALTGRIVQNCICIWMKATPTVSCPYAEPTRNVGRWCFLYTKDMARWVQWQLNRHGAALEVDGIFGKLSDAALRAFQASHGLTVDGICGAKTREALKL